MVANFLDLNNLSSQRWPFALLNAGKKSSGYRFVPECSLAQASHTCHFFNLVPRVLSYPLYGARGAWERGWSFFSAIFAGPRFCSDPDLLLPWQRDLTTYFLYLAVKLVWGEGEGGLRLSSVAALGSLYSFSRAFRTPCLLWYFNGDVIDSLISSSAFITTPFMVTDRKA